MNFWVDVRAKWQRRRNQLVRRIDSNKSYAAMLQERRAMFDAGRDGDAPLTDEERVRKLRFVDRRLNETAAEREELTRELAAIDARVDSLTSQRSDSTSHRQARMDKEQNMTREQTPQDRVLAARDRRTRQQSSVPWGASEARAHADAAAAEGEAMQNLDLDSKRPPIIKTADGYFEACPNGENADGDHTGCDTCDGAGVVKLSSVKDAATVTRVRSKLGLFGGGTSTLVGAEEGSSEPFQPTPKAGTRRVEESEIAGTGPAHKDARTRIVTDAQGRSSTMHGAKPMPLSGTIDRSRVDAAQRARQQQMMETGIPFDREQARKAMIERLRVSGFGKVK